MDKEEYSKLFYLEKTHWWFVGMRRIAFGLLNSVVSKKSKLSILDAGCGTGINALRLQNYGSVKAVDLSAEAVNFSKKRGVSTIKSSVEKLPFKKNMFDLVASFDVIYHKSIRNDLVPLKEMHRVLRPGGLLLIRVAAYNFMYSEHDRAVHTARRYTLKELKKKLENTGFIMEKATYCNTFLFPLSLLSKVLRMKGGLHKHSRVVNTIFKKLLFLESIVINRGIAFPFGLSIICIAKKQ